MNKIMDDILKTTIDNRASPLADRLMMNSILYGDMVRWSDRPLSYRLKWYFDRTTGRVRDAWLVLTGQAEIGGDY